MNILEVVNVQKKFNRSKKLFSKKKDVFLAVKNVNLSIVKGEILGIVGESGCGKSTLAQIIVGLIKADSGEIKGNSKIQLIFQDSLGSLNPKKRVGWLLDETLKLNTNLNFDGRSKKIDDTLYLVGLTPEFKVRAPHELSGGERQRISIANAIMQAPDILIADEAVSALDTVICAQIVHLLLDLREKLGLTIIFISHDLDIVYYISDKIAVMKSGEIVEYGKAENVFYKPQHTYTKELLGGNYEVGIN